MSESLHRFYTGKIVSFFTIRYIKRKTKIYFSVELRKDNGSAPAVHKAGKLRTVPREEGAMVRKLVKLPVIGEDEVLYHYTKLNGIQGIILERCMRATKSSFLNDTNEMYYILHVIRDVIGKIECPEWKELLTSQVLDTVLEMDRSSYYIVSFSTEPDSITLWAEFGDHTGYNIGFESGSLLKIMDTRQVVSYHGYVIYDRKEQEEMLRELLFERIPAALGISFEAMMSVAVAEPESDMFLKVKKLIQKALGIYALFFKQEEFAAEKEYRIAFKERGNSRILFREKEGFLAPYIAIDLSGGKKKLPIRSITVAPKNHIDLAREGMKEYLRSHGYQVDVELSRIKLRY